MHIIPDCPFATPDKAFLFEYIDDYIRGHPAFGQWNEHPILIAFILFPIPVNNFVLPSARQKIDG